MIFITGDTHGSIDIKRLSDEHFAAQKDLSRSDYIIICGDFGCVWHGNALDDQLLDWLDSRSFTTLFVDGNHENFDLLAKFPVEQWHGGNVHRIRPNILHLMRGQVFDIDGNTFFTMGGAASTDRMFRVTGLSWWPQELPCTAEYDEAKRNLERCGHTVDYILTHTPPTSVLKLLCPYPAQSDHLTDFLEEIDSSVSFRHWFFGHIHVDRDVDRYSALYQRIIALTPLDDVICREIPSDTPADDDDCDEDVEACDVADDNACGANSEACDVADADDCGEDIEACDVADDNDCGEDAEACAVADDDACGEDVEACDVDADDACGEEFEDEFGCNFFESVMNILQRGHSSDDDDLYYDYYDDDDDEVIDIINLFEPKTADTPKAASDAAEVPTDTAAQPTADTEEPHHVFFNARRSDCADRDKTDTHSAGHKTCHSPLSYLTISTVSAGICICLLMLLDVKFRFLDCIDLHAFRQFDISNFSFISLAIGMLFVAADALTEQKRTTYAAIVAGTAPICIFALGSIYILMLHETSRFHFFALLALGYAACMVFVNFLDDSAKDSSGQKTITNDIANALCSTKRALPVFILSAAICCSSGIAGIFEDLSEYATPDTRTAYEISSEIVSTYYDDPKVPPVCNLGSYVDYGYYDYYFIRFAPEAWKTQTCEEKLDALQALVNINTSRLGISRPITVRATRLNNNAVARYDRGKARIYFDNSALDNASVPELIDAAFFNCRRAYQYEHINGYLRSLGNAASLELYPELPMWMNAIDDYVYSDASVSSEGALDFIRTDADADAARYCDRFSDAFLLYLETLCAERLITTDCGTHRLNDRSVSIFMHDTHLSLFMGRDLGIPRSLGTITFPDEVEHDTAAKSLAIKDINDDGQSDICYENDNGKSVTFIGNDGKFMLLI